MKTASPETLLLISVVVAVVPLILAVGTCYLKFSIVLGLLRSGFGTQQAPSNSLVMALSIVLSLVVMEPVLRETGERLSSVELTKVGSSSVIEGSKRLLVAIEPWRDFLLKHSSERELETFRRLASGAEEGAEKVEKNESPSLAVALGAFVLSEIKKGFVIAFFLLVPFFVIDVVVSNLLVSLGLTMLSPVVVTLPLKLLLFISSDGWLLLAQSLVQSYQ
jgi:type III secretory pathway component EscR